MNIRKSQLNVYRTIDDKNKDFQILAYARIECISLMKDENLYYYLL